MNLSVDNFIEICEWDSTRFFIFSDNVFGSLIYYSHLLPLVVSILLSVFIFLKSPRLLAARWLLITTVLLGLWLFFDLILWATEKPEFTMFFWSLVNMIEPMIYAGVLFFMYAFIDGKDTSFRTKLVIFALLLPTVILTPTNLALTEYDLTNCYREAIEGPLAYYGYLIEVIFALWILILGFERFYRFKSLADKTKVALITIGAVFFLLSFAMGNVIGSLLVDWELGQYGLFGIPIFVAMLSYLIVRYHVFNVKLIATQLLVASLWVLMLAILFLRQISTVRVVVIVTLILFTILGYLLIKSVKKEVQLREALEVANEGQATLIHFINHQIKGYLSKARIIFSELLSEPNYGPINEPAKQMLTTGESSLKEGVDFVQQILRASNIEKGTMTYDMKPLDLKSLVSEVSSGVEESAKSKGLNYNLRLGSDDMRVSGDASQLKEAVKNLIDNSIKYTPSGSVTVSLEKKGSKALLSVVDTGVGLTDEVKAKLFTRGGRSAESIKINVNSTGFGLAIVKGIIEAHKGRVWAESEGEGKGSQFYIELPLAND